MINTQQLADQISSTNKIFQMEETELMIQSIADLTAIYYSRLLDKGIPSDHAATITAAYSGQIASMK